MKCKFFGRKHGRTVALVLALSLVFVTLCLPASAAEGITATLTASKNVVHSGETFTLTLALSSPAGQDVNAEISRGDQSFIIPVAAGQSQGSVEVTAGSYAKTTSEAFALKENGAFRSVESDKVSVRVLPKPQMSFNATFITRQIKLCQRICVAVEVRQHGILGKIERIDVAIMAVEIGQRRNMG